MAYSKDADLNVSLGHDNMRDALSVQKNVSVGGGSARYFIGNQNVILGAETADGQTAKGNKNVIIGADAANVIQGDRNVIIGSEALQSGVGSNDNVGIGYRSLVKNQAAGNTAVGALALTSTASGGNNVAVGVSALSLNVSGSRNVAVGVGALQNNQASVNNAVGYLALLNNTTGFENNAFGHQALEQNTTGNGNTGFGHNVMQLNKAGGGNTAIGYAALQKSQGSLNSALGAGALGANSTGEMNTALGTNSLINSTTGRQLTAVGYSAGESNSTGSDNVYIGAFANSGAVVSNSTALGTNARVSTSNTMSFGNASVTKWAFGLPTTPHALQVGSNTTNGNGAYLTVGGTWTNASSIHFKENFQEISDAELLDRLRSLEITRWNYKGTEETHIGPMAEQFSDLFGLGVKGDREHISTIDMSGVALRAIQALMQQKSIQEKKIEQMESKLAELEQRLQKLEKRLGQ
jgi:hypothetical protein